MLIFGGIRVFKAKSLRILSDLVMTFSYKRLIASEMSAGLPPSPGHPMYTLA